MASSPDSMATPLPDLPPDPMMTESMAELLLSQGHREEALRVYHDLDGPSRWRFPDPGAHRRARATQAGATPAAPVRGRSNGWSLRPGILPLDTRLEATAGRRGRRPQRSRPIEARIPGSEWRGQPARPTTRCPSARCSGKTRHQPDRPCQRPAMPRRAASRSTSSSMLRRRGARPVLHGLQIPRATISTSSIPGCRT